MLYGLRWCWPRHGVAWRSITHLPLTHWCAPGGSPRGARWHSGAPCGYLLPLNDRIVFDFDTSDIRPDAVRVIDPLGAALAKVSAKDMQVRGHTDAKGSDDHNQALSERRANAVLAALRARCRAGGQRKRLWPIAAGCASYAQWAGQSGWTATQSPGRDLPAHVTQAWRAGSAPDPRAGADRPTCHRDARRSQAGSVDEGCRPHLAVRGKPSGD